MAPPRPPIALLPPDVLLAPPALRPAAAPPKAAPPLARPPAVGVVPPELTPPEVEPEFTPPEVEPEFTPPEVEPPKLGAPDADPVVPALPPAFAPPEPPRGRSASVAPLQARTATQQDTVNNRDKGESVGMVCKRGTLTRGAGASEGL